jgi:hypothetical protein
MEGDGQRVIRLPSPLTLWTAANQDSALCSRQSHNPVLDPGLLSIIKPGCVGAYNGTTWLAD